MQVLVITFLLTLVIVILIIAGLSLRMLLVKNGEFRGGCATNGPYLMNEIGECEVCGAQPDEACKNENSTENKLDPHLSTGKQGS